MNSVMLKLVGMLIALSCFAQQIPPDRRTGTLTRVATGKEYLGTYAAASSATGIARALSIPIFRADQVYVINGGGMEYVVVESSRQPAHVIVNAPIAYAIQGDNFSFWDEEGRPHSVRIARQTLIDPGAVTSVEPTAWRSATGPERYYVRRTPGSIYAELLTKYSKNVVKYEGTGSEPKYFGHAHWTEGKCQVSADVEFKFSAPGRIDGVIETGAPGVKLNGQTCGWNKREDYAFVWVAE
jgi:hypothetical protein